MIFLHRWSNFFWGEGEGADNIFSCLRNVQTNSYEIKREKYLKPLVGGGAGDYLCIFQKLLIQPPASNSPFLPPKKHNSSKHFKIFLNLLKYFKIYQNISKFIKTFQNISKFIKTFQNLSNYFKIYLSKYFKISQNIFKIYKIFQK